MSNPTDIDRLIEDGLTSYGEGDLDGALCAWERALKLDADNAQANSYVDYVRQNYDLLTRETSDVNAAGPFGIAEDESDYQIEILVGEAAPPAAPPLHMDPLDAGWFIEDEAEPRKPRKDESSPPAGVGDPGELTLEPAPINFDDLTREYPNGPAEARRLDHAARFPAVDPVTLPRIREFQPEPTPGFGASDFKTPLGGQHTPGLEGSGFNLQVTDVRKRDTGFVKPVAANPPRTNQPSSIPPELKMTLRTPPRGSPTKNDSAELDLLASLPSPTKPVTADPPPAISPPAPPPILGTRDLPVVDRPPAGPPEPPPPTSSTRDFPLEKTQKRSSVRFNTPSENPRDMPSDKSPPTFSRELITAPTRDLGMRPVTEPPTAKPTAPAAPAARRVRDDDGTRTDVILPFDPIDARSAQILDDVDVGAPARESKEDRTRRRISALFARAVEWSGTADLDRAVAAIDLALSEDPNSALAQKLIHRNRDTMMTVFQAFLGDLQRQPALARPLHELANAPISPRAAFLLSRVDGSLSLDEILDVSGMPRLEAYRYLCQLFLRGILR